MLGGQQGLVCVQCVRRAGGQGSRDVVCPPSSLAGSLSALLMTCRSAGAAVSVVMCCLQHLQLHVSVTLCHTPSGGVAARQVHVCFFWGGGCLHVTHSMAAKRGAGRLRTGQC